MSPRHFRYGATRESILAMSNCVRYIAMVNQAELWYGILDVHGVGVDQFGQFVNTEGNVDVIKA